MDNEQNKPNLVFVHGYLGGSRQWQNQVRYLASQFNVITLDLPGFGLNNTLEAPETIKGFAIYVLNELDRIGVQNFHLVGHSMGGMIVQEVVSLAQNRVNKLVLYGTGPIGILPGRFETIVQSKHRLLSEGVENTARRISAKWFVQAELSPNYEECAAIAVQASEQAAIAGLTAMESWSGAEFLSKINTSTLVLWGDLDQSYQWSQPEKLWREIPDASLSVVAGCSHAVHLEKPQLFNAILLDFLVTDVIR